MAKALSDGAVAIVTKQKLSYQLKLFETLRPDISQVFRSAVFVVLEIAGASISTPPPPVLGVGTKTHGARRVRTYSLREVVRQCCITHIVESDFYAGIS